MKTKYTLLLIILFCIFGNIYCVSSFLTTHSRVEKTLSSIDLDTSKIIEPIDRAPNEKFLKLVREKHLFGKPDRDLKLTGILGDSILIGGEWYKEGEEKNGINLLSIKNDSALIEVDHYIVELKLYTGQQTIIESKEKTKKKRKDKNESQRINRNS